MQQQPKSESGPGCVVLSAHKTHKMLVCRVLHTLCMEQYQNISLLRIGKVHMPFLHDPLGDDVVHDIVVVVESDVASSSSSSSSSSARRS
jgi:hypothetical protein